MPINRSLYPKDWEARSLELRIAANWTCEFCGRPCLKPNETVEELGERLPDVWFHQLFERVFKADGSSTIEVRERRFLLTGAHLDQNPQNSDPSNLKALCAPCHLNYDRRYLKANAQRKQERIGQLNLFSYEAPPLVVQFNLVGPPNEIRPSEDG